MHEAWRINSTASTRVYKKKIKTNLKQKRKSQGNKGKVECKSDSRCYKNIFTSVAKVFIQEKFGVQVVDSSPDMQALRPQAVCSQDPLIMMARWIKRSA